MLRGDHCQAAEYLNFELPFLLNVGLFDFHAIFKECKASNQCEAIRKVCLPFPLRHQCQMRRSMQPALLNLQGIRDCDPLCLSFVLQNQIQTRGGRVQPKEISFVYSQNSLLDSFAFCNTNHQKRFCFILTPIHIILLRSS